MPSSGSMGSLAGALLNDLNNRGAGSAYCQYLEWVIEGPLNAPPGSRMAQQMFCDPPNPPPPSNERLPGGGTPCRNYIVQWETVSNVDGSAIISVQTLAGPIRVNRWRENRPPDRYLGRDTLIGGDGIGCPIVTFQMSGFDGIIPEENFSSIISIVPVDGLPETDTPYVDNPPPPPPQDSPDIDIDVPIQIDGGDITITLNFRPPISIPDGTVIPVVPRPNPDFNFDFDFGGNPSPILGLDLNLEFNIELTGGNGSPIPLPGSEPRPNPAPNQDSSEPGEGVDYDRIEQIVASYQCCKPVTRTVGVGNYVFEGDNEVVEIGLPGNTVLAFLTIQPGQHTRVFKMAGALAEYAHGHASALCDGNVTDYVKLYANNHAVLVPEVGVDKGLRISLKRGSEVSVQAGIHESEE